ncbi:MAG TPA: hypothetical protein VHP32_09145 [Ignavibacteria bacterium]|nr:hypothetical protein [Ignavibacteria bacterium]
MNKILLPVFVFIIFLSFKSQVSAQEANIWDFFQAYEDSSDRRLQILNATDGKYYMLYNKLFVFTRKHDLNRFLDTTGIGGPVKWDGTEIDFNENTLVLFAYHGVDCHSKFRFGFGENDDLKTYFIRVKIFYGGCRAGGRYYEKWALIPKLPEGYEVNISTTVIDEIHKKYETYIED